jgi:hypothetical protein
MRVHGFDEEGEGGGEGGVAFGLETDVVELFLQFAVLLFGDVEGLGSVVFLGLRDGVHGVDCGADFIGELHPVLAALDPRRLGLAVYCLVREFVQHRLVYVRNYPRRLHERHAERRSHQLFVLLERD